MLNLRKKVSLENKFKDFVHIINGVLRLSKRTAEVFTFILHADDTGFRGDVLNKSVRDTIKKSLGISESNISFYLSTLKRKGLIIKHGTKWDLNDNIRPVYNSNILELVFTLSIVTDNKDESIEI